MNNIRMFETEKAKAYGKGNDLFLKALGIYYLILPFGTMNIGIAGSVLRIIGFVPVIVWMVESHSTGKNRQVLYAALCVGWMMLSLFWTIDISQSLQRVFSNLTFLLLLTAAAAYEYTREDIHWLKRCLIWSSRLTAVCVLLFTGFVEGRLRMSGIMNEDPNYLCMYFVFGVAADMECICGKSRLYEKTASFGELLFYIYLILSTGSRGGAIAMGILIFCSFFLVERNRYTMRSFFKKTAVVLAGILGGFYLTNIVSEEMLKRYALSVIAASGGVGRYQQWRDALLTFWNADLFRKLFGFGSGTARTVSEIYSFSRIMVMHNMFIESLLEIGLIGLTLYSLYIFGFWNRARKSIGKSEDAFAFSVMTGMIAMSLDFSIYAFKPYWNIMIYILCLQNCKDQNSQKERYDSVAQRRTGVRKK